MKSLIFLLGFSHSGFFSPLLLLFHSILLPPAPLEKAKGGTRAEHQFCTMLPALGKYSQVWLSGAVAAQHALTLMSCGWSREEVAQGSSDRLLPQSESPWEGGGARWVCSGCGMVVISAGNARMRSGVERMSGGSLAAGTQHGGGSCVPFLLCVHSL